MDNGFVSYTLLKDRVKHGDIVTFHHPDPDYPVEHVLIKIDPDFPDVIRCIHWDMPFTSRNIRQEWWLIMKRSVQPLSFNDRSIEYNSYANGHHRQDVTFVTVKEDLLLNVMCNRSVVFAKINNQQERAEQLKRSGNRKIRIPSEADIVQYMREASSTVGSVIVFDPIFANTEHWVTLKRYSVSWSCQVSDIIVDAGIWKFLVAAVSAGEAGISNFFRAFGLYSHTPLGRLAHPLVNRMLPSAEVFVQEMSTISGTMQFSRSTFLATSGTIGIILSMLTWFWASLRDIVSKPSEKIITSEEELSKAYQGIDHFPVVCNMGLMVTGLIPTVLSMFVSWLRDFVSKILDTLDNVKPSIRH